MCVRACAYMLLRALEFGKHFEGGERKKGGKKKQSLVLGNFSIERLSGTLLCFFSPLVCILVAELGVQSVRQACKVLFVSDA